MGLPFEPPDLDLAFRTEPAEHLAVELDAPEFEIDEQPRERHLDVVEELLESGFGEPGTEPLGEAQGEIGAGGDVPRGVRALETRRPRPRAVSVSRAGTTSPSSRSASASRS